MERSYCLAHPATGRVLSAQSPFAGGRLQAVPRPERLDKAQLFALEYDGDEVYMHSAAAPGLVVNMHSRSGEAILWPRAQASSADSLLDTKTQAGNQQVFLPRHEDRYLTLEEGGVRFLPRQGKDAQYWRLEEVVPQAATAVLGVENIKQGDYTREFGVNFANRACLAVCALAMVRLKWPGVTMQQLVAAGIVRRADAYLNHPNRYFAFRDVERGSAPAVYCGTIARALRGGVPVVVKLEKAGYADHYVVVDSCVEATPAGIYAMDPTYGEKLSLAEIYARHGKAYAYTRICEYRG